MDTLLLDGKKYVKASSIARDLGYTADYVGQLCRAEKIDAHLVGRSWYVSEDELVNHKRSKHRSSFKYSKKELTKAREDEKVKKSDESKTVPAPREAFYTYAELGNYKYEKDTSDLIPILTRDSSPGRAVPIDVIPADAKELKVSNSSSPYTITRTKKPEIQFRGALSVEDGDEQTVGKTEKKEKESKKEQKKATLKDKADISDTQVRAADQKKQHTKTKDSACKKGMLAVHAADGDESRVVCIKVTELSVPHDKRETTALQLASVGIGVLGVLTAVASLFVVQTVSVVEGVGIETNYSVAVEGVFESVINALEI